MGKKIFKLVLAAALLISSSAVFAEVSSMQKKVFTPESIKLFPVPDDNRNYFFLQSLGGNTSIVIGDFSKLEKRIILIEDKDSDNTIDAVYEYYPETKILKKSKSSESSLFSKDIVSLKKDIITGAAFEKNYCDDMKSLNILESILKDGDYQTVHKDVYGYKVEFHEIDETNKFASVFSYGKNAQGYYMLFRTDYYRKNFRTKIRPLLRYSVYCKGSKDPVVKETVENLFKIRKYPADIK